MSTHRRDAAPTVTGEFEHALASLRGVTLRPEVSVQETPSPSRLAPNSVAILGEAVIDTDEIASGRFVLLHDPEGQEPWGGRFRVVSFVRATVELEMATDSLVSEVAWSWLLEALDDHGAQWTLPSGTVTRTASQSFGALADRPPAGEVEIRASWTPTDPEIAPHLVAWADLLAHVGGLPPLPPGVTALPRRRSTGR